MIKMNNQIRTVIIACSLLLCAAPLLNAQVPHLLFGEVRNSDGSVPFTEDVSFNAYNLSAPDDVIDNLHSGQTGVQSLESPQRLVWIVQCSDFAGRWRVGDQVHVELSNSATGEINSITVALTDEPYQDLGNLVLPVQLSLFEAQRTEDRIILHWRTEDEMDCLGFNVLRKMGKHGIFITINDDLIRAAGGIGVSQDYFCQVQRGLL